jgi:nucleoside-diphosphate-sugar epimerase
MKRAAWAENDRIRTEGTKALVDAALRADVGTIVYPSICLLYADNGERWIDETGVIHAPPLLYSAVLAEKEIERFGEDGGRGIILRMGGFTGPDAPNTEEGLGMARRGIAPLIGPPDAYFSQILVADAAAAVVAALGDVPTGTYNVVEDEPETRGQIAVDFARKVGRKRLYRIPLLLVRLLAGRSGLALARSQRVSNRLFKETAGWEPG